MKKEKSTTEFPIHSCPGKLEIPTKKEQEALAELRKIKEKARLVKSQLKKMKAPSGAQDSERVSQLESDLARLKELWDFWEKRRQAAEKERMILLGHAEPETE